MKKVLIILLLMFGGIEAQSNLLKIERRFTGQDLQANAGEVLGSELVTNGGFDDASWWGIDAGGGISIADGVCHFANTPSTYSLFKSAFFTLTKHYSITYTVKNYVTGSIRVQSGAEFGTVRTANGTYTEKLFTLGSTPIYFASRTSNTTLDIDDVSVKEVLSASTPLLLNFNSTRGAFRDLTGKSITNVSTTITKDSSITSATFDGADSYLSIPTVDMSGSITICAWVKASGWGEGNLGNILNNGKEVLRVNTTNGLINFSRDNISTVTTSATNSVILDRWLFVAITSTNTGITNTYIGSATVTPALNGTANQSAGTPSASSTLIIGNKADQSRTFAGRIGEVRIYNSILTLTNQMVNKIWKSTKDYYRSR